MPNADTRVNATLRLRFDEESEGRLIKLFARLQKLRVNSRLSPHLTIATADNLPLLPTIEALEKIIGTQASFSIELASFGLFPTKVLGNDAQPFVFQVQPICTIELLELHRSVVQALQPLESIRLRPHHQIGQWVPHVTIAIRLSPQKLVDLITAAKDVAGFPMRLKVNRVEFISDRREVTYKLNGFH